MDGSERAGGSQPEAALIGRFSCPSCAFVEQKNVCIGLSSQIRSIGNSWVVKYKKVAWIAGSASAENHCVLLVDQVLVEAPGDDGAHALARYTRHQASKVAL